MKLAKFTILILSIITIFSLQAKDKDGAKPAYPETSKADTIVWLSYNEAIAKSADKDQHIFIHFTTRTCGWCRKMERETYKDSAVVRMLNDNFAPVKIWADAYDNIDVEGYQISQAALAKNEFGVASYPQFWFVNPDKMKVGPLKGYLSVDRFMKSLEYVSSYTYDTSRTEDGKKKEQAVTKTNK